MPVVLIANKADLESKVSLRKAQSFAQKKNWPLFVCSTVTGKNIEEAFEQMAEELGMAVSAMQGGCTTSGFTENMLAEMNSNPSQIISDSSKR